MFYPLGTNYSHVFQWYLMICHVYCECYLLLIHSTHQKQLCLTKNNFQVWQKYDISFQNIDKRFIRFPITAPQQCSTICNWFCSSWTLNFFNILKKMCFQFWRCWIPHSIPFHDSIFKKRHWIRRKLVLEIVGYFSIGLLFNNYNQSQKQG